MNPKKYVLILSLTMLCLAIQTNAQQIKLVSEIDESPVSFASALLLQNNIGTISDENGILNINLPLKDTLVISHLGYEIAHIATNEIHANDIIKLKPTTYSLAEVTVKPISALKIVKKAKDFIPLNYPISTSRYNLSVENLIINNDSIYCCLRGSFICTTTSYKDQTPCEYRLVEADTYINNREKTDLVVPRSLDAYPACLIDKMHLLNLDFISNTNSYNYAFADSTTLGTYNIVFSPKKITDKHYLKGLMVINSTDMAIMKIEYTTAAPDIVAHNDVIVEMSYRIKVHSLGKHHIKSCSTTIDFEKVKGYYQMAHAANKFDYKYIGSTGNIHEYSAENSVVNHFGTVDSIDNYKPIALDGSYNLSEWKRNNIKSNISQKYLSRKISKTIQTLKEKYPDMDFDELQKATE